jgi:hypothetical protein
MADLDLREFGGSPQIAAGADPNDPNSITWNFGVLPPIERVKPPALGDIFPNLQGRWDGKTRINHHESVRKVLGSNIKAHLQPRGTCGGRAGSRSLEILQCVMIANGRRAKFKYVSHAWVYYAARAKYHMLQPGERNDGVASGAVEEILAESGALNRDEAGDPEMAGPTSDDVAVKWGGGGLSKSDETKFRELAKDNIVTAHVTCKSAQDMADVIASGGVVICSDNQGYTMTRDQNGFCKPQGQWAHYQMRSGVGDYGSGGKGFEYNQSWGDTTPSGPIIDGCPGNVFRTPWSKEDQLAKSDTREGLLFLELWELESGKFDLKWDWS